MVPHRVIMRRLETVVFSMCSVVLIGRSIESVLVWNVLFTGVIYDAPTPNRRVLKHSFVANV